MQTFLFTSTQFITYPVQTSDSSLFSLFSRFLTPYNPSTYSPSIAFLFRTNVRLTPLQPLSYPFNYSHSIAFLSTYNPPTYSPSITLLSTHQRPTYSPSIPFLLTYNRYLTLTNVRLTPLQTCYLPRTTVRLTHLQTPYLFHTNLGLTHVQSTACPVTTSGLSLFNSTQRFRFIRIESVTYSSLPRIERPDLTAYNRTLTHIRKPSLSAIQSRTYLHTEVGFTRLHPVRCRNAGLCKGRLALRKGEPCQNAI